VAKKSKDIKETKVKKTKIKTVKASHNKSKKLEKLYSQSDDAQCKFESCDYTELTKVQHDIQTELKSRRSILKKEIADNCEIHQSLSNIGNSRKADRIYKLSVTDLFVEKAIQILNDEATKHERNGKTAFYVALLTILIGVIISFIQVFDLHQPNNKVVQQNTNIRNQCDSAYIRQAITYDNIVKTTDNIKEEHNISKINDNVVKNLIDKEVSLAWKDALVSFMKSFTFYGLLVLLAVFLKRQGKASLDQAERIKDKKHALREGRLYIHLKDGQIKTVEELEQAFNWNDAQHNAFAEVNTEAQAPWGTVFKEFANMFPKAIEASKK